MVWIKPESITQCAPKTRLDGLFDVREAELRTITQSRKLRVGSKLAVFSLVQSHTTRLMVGDVVVRLAREALFSFESTTLPLEVDGLG